jgi:hypothetical protein
MFIEIDVFNVVKEHKGDGYHITSLDMIFTVKNDRSANGEIAALNSKGHP